jgi:hypothetical protein
MRFIPGVLAGAGETAEAFVRGPDDDDRPLLGA